MKQMFTVFGFTLRGAVKKKSFAISTAIILILIVVLCTALRISYNNNDGAKNEQINIIEDKGICYYIDEANVIPGGREALSAVFKNMEFIPAKTSQRDSLTEKAKDDSKLSIISISEKDKIPQIEIISKDFMSGIPASAVSQILGKAFQGLILMQSGLDPQTAALAMTDPVVTSTYASERDTASFLIGILITMLMFFAIYFYGYGVSMSIATEKTSRVMETLVVSAKPSVILVGKCLAMGTLGLIQLGMILTVGTVCWSTLIPEGFTLMGMEISFSGITPSMMLIMVLYFILGYALYAVMNAVCGASVSKIEDLNTALMPVMLVCMASFYLGYFAALVPNSGALQRVAMYIPFSAPFIVPFRLLNGEAAAGDIVISVLLMLAAIAAVTALSVKIYSASVLHYGKKLRLKDVFGKK